jgi:aspartyl protease family protein
MNRIASWLLLAIMLPAAAQTVTFNGRMGDRALLVIDGQPRVMTAGQTVQGVTVDSVAPEEARLHVNGRGIVVRQGTPVSLGGAAGGEGGREIVLSAGPGGHYWTAGSINQQAVNFIVDTGATYVSMSTAEADRLGLSYRNGERGVLSTANGHVAAYQALLTSVRVGDVELHNVAATISEGAMDYILLGNSFLSHFDLQRVGDTMRLSRKY